MTAGLALLLTGIMQPLSQVASSPQATPGVNEVALGIFFPAPAVLCAARLSRPCASFAPGGAVWFRRRALEALAITILLTLLPMFLIVGTAAVLE